MQICCKLIAFALAAITLSDARGGVPTEWQVRIGPKATVYQAERYHGDALDLRATLTSGGLPLVYQGAARLYAQTNGMGARWWDLADVTVASNVLAATWLPEFDTGADVVDVFLGAPSNFQAHARIRFLPSPGPAPNSLPMPVQVLDFAAVELRNVNALTNGWEFGNADESGYLPAEVGQNNRRIVTNDVSFTGRYFSVNGPAVVSFKAAPGRYVTSLSAFRIAQQEDAPATLSFDDRIYFVLTNYPFNPPYYGIPRVRIGRPVDGISPITIGDEEVATKPDATNAAVAVADAKISTNNAAFVSAVLAAPLAGADAEDIAEIAEYGGYGTVGTALLALIAGLAALKRRVGAAETALSGKADLSAVGNATITLSQGGVTKGTFTTNQSANATIDLDAGGGGAIATISLAGAGSAAQSVSVGGRKYANSMTEGTVVVPVFAGDTVSVNYDEFRGDCWVFKNGVVQKGDIPSTLEAGDAWLIYFGSCLAYGTLISMADGTFKRVEDLSVGDVVASVDPYDGAMSSDVVVAVSRGSGSAKDDWTFEGGRTVSTVGRHRFWNVDLGEMLYLEAWNPGERARVFDGTDVKLVKRATSFGEFRYATLWTEKWNNYFANGLLSGNRKTVKGAY